MSIVLTLSVLGKNKTAGDNLNFFSYFSQKIGYDISCELSPQEAIRMKYQSLFSGEKDEKYHKYDVCRISQECGKGQKPIYISKVHYLEVSILSISITI